MITLPSNVTDNYLKTGTDPRFIVRLPNAGSSGLEFRQEIKDSGTISRTAKPQGGLEQVSNITVRNLELEDELEFTSTATRSPLDEGAIRGAGRCMSQGIPTGPYTDTRNSTTGAFATGAVTVGQKYDPGSAVYYTYRGFLQFSIPALTSCEEFTIWLRGLSDSSTSDFDVVAVLGNWSALSYDSAIYNDFCGWAASGAYTVKELNDTANSAEYVTYDSDDPENESHFLIRFNKDGLDQVVAAQGSTLKIMLLSRNDIDNTAPTGDEFMQFTASTAEARLRYDTYELTNQEARLYMYYPPEPASYGDMLERYRGVVDSFKISNNQLELNIKKSDLLLNTVMPSRVLDTESFPNLNDRNVGKALPILYGDFTKNVEHRDGIAYAEDETNGTGYEYGMRDFAIGYVYTPATSAQSRIYAAFCGHEVKELDFYGAYYADEIKSYCIIAGDVTDISTSSLTKIYISDGTASKWPHDLTKTDQTSTDVQPVVCYSPKVVNYVDTQGTTSHLNLLKPGINEYFEIGGNGALEEAWYGFGNAFNLTDKYDTIYALVRTEASGYAANSVGMGLLLYYGTASEVVKGVLLPVISSNGWHYREIDVADLPDEENSLSEITIYLYCTDTSNSTKFYNLCLCGAYKKEITETIGMSIKGRPDDGSGTITGTASLLIENPAHVVHSIAVNEVGMASSKIDTSGMSAAASNLSNWDMAFQLFERQSSNQIFDRIGEESRSSVEWDELDRLTIRNWDSTAYFPHSGTDIPGDLDIFQRDPNITLTSGSEVAARNVIIGDVILNPVPDRDIYNSFELHFRKNYATGEYMEVLTIDNGLGAVGSVSTNLVAGDESNMENSQTIANLKALCANSYTKRGSTTNQMVFNADYIRDRATAVKLLQHLVEYYSPRRMVARLVTRENALWLENGDLINIRHFRVNEYFGTATADRKKWFVYRTDHDTKTGDIDITAIDATSANRLLGVT